MSTLKRRFFGLFSVLAATSCMYAASEGYIYGVHENVTHGLANIGSCWMEIPMQIKKGYSEGVPGAQSPEFGRFVGCVQGVYNGLSHGLGRLTWGIVEVAGCWAANPPDNESIQMLLDADYAWEEGNKTRLFTPSAAQGFDQIGNRLERGAKNLLGSPVELIGQPRKAVALDGWLSLPVGVVRGIWATGSRIIYGAGDILLSPVPGPVENYGVAFPDDNPWDGLVTDYCKKCRVARKVCGCPKPMAPQKASGDEPEIEEEALEEGATAE